jgi:hypothetical protein
LAEHFAICLLPLTFYTFRRVMRGVGGRGTLLASVLSLAAVVFSHNLLGLVCAALLLGYWLWLMVFGTARRAGWGVIVFALSAALIAFFWLPALLEWSLVDLKVTGPGHFDFREHFLSLGELLAPMPVLDLGATAPRYPFTLGLMQWLLALPALILLIRRGLRRELTFFVLTALSMGLLMLPLSQGIWEFVPRMEYLQFPWRLLGPTNLMLALCAASISALLPRKVWRGPVLAGVLSLLLAFALPALYPPMWAPDFGGTTARDIINWEIRSLAYGTTSTGDFVPKGAVLAPIDPMPSLLDSYVGDGPVDKVNRAGLPAGAQVEIVSHGPAHDYLHISTPESFLFRVYTFYFPGWHAYVDGEEVEIEVAGPEGFITFWIPAGDHEVEIRFEDTPPRRVGWVVSAVGALALAVALWIFPGAHRGRGARKVLPESIWLLAVVVCFFGVKSLVIDPRDNWLRYTSPPGQAWAAQYEQQANFGGKIELLGYDLPRPRVRSGDELSVVLYWHALQALDANYQSFVHVARPLHLLWGQEDHLNPGGLPTTRWPLGRYVWDEYRVEILPGTPPGEYLLNVGLYLMGDGYRLPRYDETGQAAGDSLPLASVTVERPRRQPDPVDLEMTHPLTVTFPDAGVTLLGYQLLRPKVKLPGSWELILFWRAERDQPAAAVRDFVMLDDEGHEVWRISGPPADYPFDRWRAGEIVRDPIVFTAVSPVSLVTGRYPIGVVLSADRPILPRGAEDVFLPLGYAAFRVKENE